ncbi:MAG: hypothetical protein WCX73_01085 [Candidatus Pacearchaeota archaeon]|jgi:hypothetical protein
MDLIWHVFWSAIISKLLGFEAGEILFIILGSVIIDIDHIFYMVFCMKIKSLKEMIKFHRTNFKTMTPHFYILHFLELSIVLLIFSYITNQNIIFLISFGMLLHWIADAVKYIWFYKSVFPWIKYYSLIVYIRSKFIN